MIICLGYSEQSLNPDDISIKSPMEWKDWNCVPFDKRDYLPLVSGIYVVTDSKDVVWYVGQAQNIKKRWAGRGHHRYQQLLRTNKKRNYSIYWKKFSVEELPDKEKQYINQFNPELNRSRVKRYVPSEPIKIREIRRIVKALNKLNQWHPRLRSIIIGRHSSDDLDQIFIACCEMDIGIPSNSTDSKKSILIRKSWSLLRPTCGLNEETYQAPFIYSFNLAAKLEIVFLCIDELVATLEFDQDLYKKFVLDINFLGTSAKSLKSKDIFGELQISEKNLNWKLIHKTVLSDFAYLKLFLEDVEPIHRFEVYF